MSNFKSYIDSINSTLDSGQISYDAASSKAEYIKSKIDQKKKELPNSKTFFDITQDNKGQILDNLKVYFQFNIGRFQILKEHIKDIEEDGVLYNYFKVVENVPRVTQFFTSTNIVKIDIMSDERFTSFLEGESIITKPLANLSFRLSLPLAASLIKYILKIDKLKLYI